MTSKLDLVRKGKAFTGKNELIRFLEGEHLTPRERILAYCYDCMGFFADGKHDCRQTECPLYGVMRWAKEKNV